MSTTSPNPDDRLPTTGPEEVPFEQFRFTTTTDGNGLLYHVDHEDQWIESETTVTLETWR